MNKVVLIIFFFALSSNAANAANAGIVEEVRACYIENDYDFRAQQCADMKMAHAIKRLQNADNSSNDEVEVSSHSIVYGCRPTAGDSELIKYIIDGLGTIVRSTVVKVYTQGGGDFEKKACRTAALEKQNKVGFGIRTECSCAVNGGNSVLSFNLLNKDYQVIRSIDIGIITTGDDAHERATCYNLAATEAICNIP